MGEALFSFSNDSKTAPLKHKRNVLTCTFPKYFFQSGTYYLSLILVKDKRFAVYEEKDIMSFVVIDAGREIGNYMGREPGSIRPTFSWINRES